MKRVFLAFIIFILLSMFFIKICVSQDQDSSSYSYVGKEEDFDENGFNQNTNEVRAEGGKFPSDKKPVTCHGDCTTTVGNRDVTLKGGAENVAVDGNTITGTAGPSGCELPNGAKVGSGQKFSYVVSSDESPDEIIMAEGGEITELPPEKDIKITGNDITLPDGTKVISGSVVCNSDGSFTLEGEKGVTEVMTPQGVYVMTMTEDTTLYTKNAPDSCTQCVMVDDSDPERNYVYMDGDGIRIQLYPDKTAGKKWQLDVGDSEGTSFVLDKNGDVALTINDGRPNQMPRVALGDTGFSEMNSETGYHWEIGDETCDMEICESSSVSPTGAAIVDVTGYASFLSKCIGVAKSYASGLGYENLAKPDEDDCTGDGCTYNLRGEVVVRDEDGEIKMENGKAVLTPMKEITGAIKTVVYLEQGKPEPGDFYIVGDQIYQVSDRLTSEGWKQVFIPIKKEEHPTSSKGTSTFLHYDGKVYTYNIHKESMEHYKQTPNEKFEESLPEHLKSGETSKLKGNGAKFLNYINYLKENRVEYKSVEETKTTIVYEIKGNKYFFTKDGRSLNANDPPGWPGS